MIRSALAGIATAWFAFNALEFVPVGAYLNDGAPGGIDGDAGAVAVAWAARTLFAGLAALALAVVDWDWMGRVILSAEPSAATPVE